jgi:hypothetical protein
LIPNPRYTVRPMTLEDIPSCDQLYQESNGISRKNYLISELEDDYYVKYVVLENNEIV